MRIAVSRRVWQAGVAGVLALGAAGGWWHAHERVAAAANGKAASAAYSFAKPSIAFEPNQGQSDGRVLFLSRNPGYSLYLTAQDAVLSLRGAAQPLRLAWQGANPNPHVSGLESLPGKHHYLRGNDPAKWHRDIPTYGKVRYRDLYPGIDLIYYGQQQRLEYDLVVAPGADPAQIRLHLAGMDAMSLDRQGALRLKVANQTLVLSKPLIYQETAGEKRIVDGEYRVAADNQVVLKLAAYDATKPLIIDPVLSYSTYLGGSGAEQGMGVAVDSGGNIYMVGQTASAVFPPTTKSTTDTDVFVAKYNSAGTLQSAVYLGGSGTDRGFGIAADSSAVYIVGDTDSANFPTQNAEQAAKGGGSSDIDAFVAKFNSADLSLSYSTYLGGSMAEEGRGIAVDGSGNAYVAGATLSDDFPFTAGAYQTARKGGGVCDDPTKPDQTIPCSDAFVAKYDSAGVKQYGTYLGGTYQEAANAIAVNSAGEAYVTGVTYSGDFPEISASGVQRINKGRGDAFIAKLNAAGSTVAYATYLGGDGWDQGQAIALDSSGDVYVAGATNSSAASLPLKNPLQAVYGGGGYDGFVAKLVTISTGYDIQYFTYLGGTKQDIAFGLAVNNTSGAAVVAGETMSTDFPLYDPLQHTWFGGGKNNWGDAFVTEIDQSGFPVWSTYLGGSDDDWANGVALDGSGGIYVAGSSFSSDFPTVQPYQAGAAGNSDALLVKLDDTGVTADVALSASATPDPVSSGETLTYQLVVSNNSASNNAGGVVIAATLPGGVSFKSASAPGSCTASGAQVTCNVGSLAPGATATVTIAGISYAAGNITFNATVARANQPDPDITNNSASVTTMAAVGDSGGGVWSPLEWLVGMAVYFLRRQRSI